MMLSYIIRRFLIAIPTLLVIAIISFGLMHFAPGGPFDTEKPPPPNILANLKAKYHLDKSLPVQFLIYIKNFLKGDLGLSYAYNDFTVNDLIKKSWPVSAELGAWAFGLAIVVGILLGIFAGLNQNSKLDYVLMTSAMTGIVIPNFVVAPLLVLIFSVQLGWLPAGGWNDGRWQNLILPVIALSLVAIANIARLMRGSMIEVLNSDYIRSARSRGLGQIYILFRHALRPALLPLIGYLAPTFVYIVTGQVVIDVFFTTGGMGQQFVYGALNRDYGMVMGITMVIATMTILFNSLVDVFLALIDPRIRIQ